MPGKARLPEQTRPGAPLLQVWTEGAHDLKAARSFTDTFSSTCEASKQLTFSSVINKAVLLFPV